VQGNNYFCKLDARRVNLLLERLESLRKHFFVDFAKNPRNFNKKKNWKTTELYLFLLYIRLFIFNGIISNNHIEHFRIFHVAILILSQKN